MSKHRQEWHAVAEVLAHFGKTWRAARSGYCDFMQAGLASSNGTGLSGGGLVRSYGGWESIGRLRQEHIVCIGDERILGNSSFVERVLQEDGVAIESRSRLARDGWNLDKLPSVVCKRCEVMQSDLLLRSREDAASRAKALICYFGTEKLGLRAREIAEKLDISRPAVSRWVTKGRKLGQEEVWIDLFDQVTKLSVSPASTLVWLNSHTSAILLICRHQALNGMRLKTSRIRQNTKFLLKMLSMLF